MHRANCYTLQFIIGHCACRVCQDPGLKAIRSPFSRDLLSSISLFSLWRCRRLLGFYKCHFAGESPHRTVHKTTSVPHTYSPGFPFSLWIFCIFSSQGKVLTAPSQCQAFSIPEAAASCGDSRISLAILHHVLKGRGSQNFIQY